MATGVVFHEAMSTNLRKSKREIGLFESFRFWPRPNSFLLGQISMRTIAKTRYGQITIMTENPETSREVVLLKPFVKIGPLASNFPTMLIPSTANVVNPKKLQTIFATTRAESSIMRNNSFAPNKSAFSVSLQIAFWIFGIPSSAGGIPFRNNMWSLFIFARTIANAIFAPMSFSIRPVFVVPKIIERQNLRTSGTIFHNNSLGSD